MYREIDNKLISWSKSSTRRVLLLRGARQVGKTFAVRKLGTHYKRMIEVNFDFHKEVASFFQQTLEPAELIKKLELYYNKPIVPGETLLFFDEIQSCIEAIRSLRYFYERIPQLHVVAAGSLLEFTLSEIPSFGVGRIESMYLYPMSFSEFLIAGGSELQEKAIAEASPDNPLDPVIHTLILEKLKMFQLIGGMPEVVQQYVKTGDIHACQKILALLVRGYEDDFAKYKRNAPVARLKETYISVASQSGSKFKYTSVGEEPSARYRDALEMICKAGIAHKVQNTSGNGLPLGAESDYRRFKVIVSDTGLLQRLIDLDLSEYAVMDFASMINKGPLAEIFVGNELIKQRGCYAVPELFYWHREAKSSNAEVDYLIADKGRVVPVEVKSGVTGKLRSMQLFIKEKKSPVAIKISQENFNRTGDIITLPLYASGYISRYKWL